MANRRMFSKEIVFGSRFLRMPPTCRLLYYDIGMNADDDGYCEWYPVIQMSGAKDQDLEVLQANGFIKILDKDVLIIKDWKLNNYIQTDRYQKSRYLAIFPPLDTGRIHNVSEMDTQDRIGKDRIGKETETPLFKKIDYLDQVPLEDVIELKAISSATEDNIKSKAQDLKDYCASHGKRYKDYKAFLRNAIKRDFPVRSITNSITIRA